MENLVANQMTDSIEAKLTKFGFPIENLLKKRFGVIVYPVLKTLHLFSRQIVLVEL